MANTGKRSTKEEFEQKSRRIYGDKYDYSKVVYTNNYTKVNIVCPIHGEFVISPMSHLAGCGCPLCKKDEKKHLIYGIGTNDSYGDTKSKSFEIWYNILRRCYDKSYHKGKPTYEEAEICDEWKKYSVFKIWFDANYKDGYQLDKDILVKNNKVYSPSTCCFVPPALNFLLTKSNHLRGKLPIGVRKASKGDKYEARLSIYKRYIHIGTFATQEEAFEAYKKAKEGWIKRTAKEHFEKGLICNKIYEALINYKVEVRD